MYKKLASIPIFRRLFLAFFLAVLIPDAIIILQSIVYTNALVAHGLKLSQTGPFTIGTILALVASTGVVILLGSLLNSTITQPLSQLAKLAQRIRDGDTSARATLTGRDEIGIVAESINAMLNQIVSLLNETQNQRDYLQDQLRTLIQEVKGVGQGDLSVHVKVTHESLSFLADSFNYMLETLGGLVIRVKQVAFEVERSTAETQPEMMQMVTTADTLLKQIDRTAGTIETMAQSCLQVVERTKTLDLSAKKAKGEAQQGRQIVHQTLKGIEAIQHTAKQTAAQMRELGEHSFQIEEVIDLLETIAQHTTRLSLDAAIQVRMAGNANSGFVAIAEDIRRLSEQTKEQLTTVSRTVKGVRTDILNVVGSIQQSEQETVTGVARIKETGESLSIIFSVIEQQAEDIEIILHMMEQLFRFSREIAQVMHTISEYTEKSSKNTQNVANKVWKLVTYVQYLRRSVEVFKVKDDLAHSSEQNYPIAVK